MVVLPSTGASRYHNCCTDGGTSPESVGCTFLHSLITLYYTFRSFTGLFRVTNWYFKMFSRTSHSPSFALFVSFDQVVPNIRILLYVGRLMPVNSPSLLQELFKYVHYTLSGYNIARFTKKYLRRLVNTFYIELCYYAKCK
jgi:hypothetical protein